MKKPHSKRFVVKTSQKEQKNMSSSSRENRLYTYVKKVLKREDEEISALFLESQERLPQITSQLKEETFSFCVQAIADELFETREESYPYVMVLLAFSLKLDEYCKQYDWYNTEFLIQILVNILAKTAFNPPNKYCVILYQGLFFLTISEQMGKGYLKSSESHSQRLKYTGSQTSK